MSHAPRHTSGIALRAIHEFRCLGSECEITCCAGWQIPLSADDLKGLEEAVGFSAEATAAFDEVVKRRTDLPVLGTEAVLTMGPKGTCAFLDEAQLCSVHSARGHDAIPTICALYPRRFASVEGRLEMTPLVSCPEAARQLLLRPDGAEIVDLDPEEYPRLIANHVVEPGPADPHRRYMDDLRVAILGLLARDEAPLDARLYFVTRFVARIDALLTAPETTEDDLAAVLNEFGDPGALARHWDEYDTLELPDLLGTSLAYRAVAPLARSSAKLATLFSDALGTYGSEATLAGEYAARSALYEEIGGDILDRAFTNLSANYWMQSYLDTDRLLHGLRTLVVQIQLLRLLTLGDADLEATRRTYESGEIGASDVRTELERAIVRVVFTFARATEHDPDFWTTADGALDRAGVSGPDAVLALLPRFPAPALAA